MMDAKTLGGMWDLMRQKHGITLRIIESLPEGRLGDHVVPKMRSSKELVVHMYETIIKAITEGVASGKVVADEAAEAGIAAKLTTKQDLVRYAEECWKAADAAVKKIGDAQLAASVETPWGFAPPGAMLMGLQNDEYIHHRGQLYAFARALGIEPPYLWDFSHNAEAYRPKQTSQA